MMFRLAATMRIARIALFSTTALCLVVMAAVLLTA